MSYIKRLLLLAATIILVFVKINFFSNFKQDFSFYNFMGLILNVLIVGGFILIFYTASQIVRHPGIILFELFIILWLLFFSLYVPIYYLGANPFTDLFAFIIDNLSIVTYAQLMLGIWFMSFIRILMNQGTVRRSSYSNYKRY